MSAENELLTWILNGLANFSGGALLALTVWLLSSVYQGKSPIKVTASSSEENGVTEVNWTFSSDSPVFLVKLHLTAEDRSLNIDEFYYPGRELVVNSGSGVFGGILYYKRFRFLRSKKFFFGAKTTRKYLVNRIISGGFYREIFPSAYASIQIKRLLRRCKTEDFEISIFVGPSSNFTIEELHKRDINVTFSLTESVQYVLGIQDVIAQRFEKEFYEISEYYGDNDTSPGRKLTATINRKSVEKLSRYFASTQSLKDRIVKNPTKNPKVFLQETNYSRDITQIGEEKENILSFTHKDNFKEIRIASVGRAGIEFAIDNSSYKKDDHGILIKIENEKNRSPNTLLFIGKDGFCVWAQPFGMAKTLRLKSDELDDLMDHLYFWDNW